MQPKVGVAYTLALPGEGDRHKFGVNALALTRNTAPQASWAGGISLFTAGRDARVRRWDVTALESGGGFSPRRPARKLPLVATYSDHSDWVNAVVVAPAHGLLVSASSDHTLKLWPLDEPDAPEARATVNTHTDYVKALAYAPSSGVLASASLDKMIHLFKMDTLARFASSGGTSGGVEFSADGNVRDGPTVLAGHRDSVYCLAMNTAGTLIASGSVEPEVRLWDARTARKHAKLAGHTDVVRALLLDADGRTAVSASSDRTVRVWDVGSQRCIHTLRVHRDAAWALDVDAGWATLYSGGRDGSIVATSLSTFRSARVAHEAAPIVRLASSVGGTHLWSATTRSDVRCWSLDGVGAALQAGASHAAALSDAEETLTPRSAGAHGRGGGGGGGGGEAAAGPLPAVERDAVGVIEGAPAIHSSRVLADRWRVLTCDTSDRIVVWDVLRGSVVRTFPEGTSLASAERELHLERAVPSWFSVDTKSGDLTICLDEKSAFAGLLYADDVGLTGPDVTEDTTVNLGWNALTNVFGPWIQHKQQQSSSGRGGGGRTGTSKAAGRANAPTVKLEAPAQARAHAGAPTRIAILSLAARTEMHACAHLNAWACTSSATMSVPCRAHRVPCAVGRGGCH